MSNFFLKEIAIMFESPDFHGKAKLTCQDKMQENYYDNFKGMRIFIGICVFSSLAVQNKNEIPRTIITVQVANPSNKGEFLILSKKLSKFFI